MSFDPFVRDALEYLWNAISEKDLHELLTGLGYWEAYLGPGHTGGSDLDTQNYTTENHDPALVMCCRSGFLAGVDPLLHAGANCESTNSRGNTALLLAIQGGFEPIVQMLVERGCQIDYFNESCHLWSFPLGEASRAGQASTVSLLLEHGAQLDMTDMIGRNALHLAAFNDRPEVCAVLIGKGFDPTVQDEKGRTALSHYGYFLTDDYSGWADPNAHETEEFEQDFGSMEFFDVDTFFSARRPLTDEAKQERVTQLKQLVLDYHWGRRAAFIHTLVGSGIRLTAAQTAEHALIQAASDKSAKIPPIPRKTKAQNIAYLNTQIFGAEGNVRKIAEYL